MFAHLRSAARRHDLVKLAGLASGVVPLAVVVHILTELVVAAPGPADAFVLRHAYMLPLVAASLVAFGATLGWGGDPRDTVRRCALTRAALQRVGLGAGVRDLFLANVAFFALTQALEGVPIATGSVALGLGIAALGSLLAAFIVFAFGRTLAIALVLALARVSHAAPSSRGRRRRIDTPRAAARPFSLFVPNRPPPDRSFA